MTDNINGSNSAQEAVIREYLKMLKMPAVGRQFPALARQARDGSWTYESFLKEVLEVEIASRQEHAAATRLKQACLPEIKTLDQVDWEALQGISRPKILELSSCEYIKRGEDLIFAGPIGTGKSMLSICLGAEAARRLFRVLFIRAANLVRQLLEARDDRALGRFQQKLHKADLLIIDELGFVPFDRAGGELIFNVFAERYSRRSACVTTNPAFSEWVQVFGDEKLTTALLDRLGHRAHILTTKGASYRTQKQRRKKEADQG
jgi:DNA replication protein DnaC